MSPGAQLPQTPAEAWLSTWSRRAVSIPSLFLFGTLYLFLSPLFFCLALATDLVSALIRINSDPNHSDPNHSVANEDQKQSHSSTRTRLSAGLARLPRTRALAFFALYFLCEFFGVAAAALLWVWDVFARDSQRFLEGNAALQRLWTSALFTGAVTLFSVRIEASGLELARRGPLLLFVRHSSTADTVLTAALVANPNRLLLRYVLKRELLWDPCLDIVGQRLPNAFVHRQRGRSEAEAAAVAGLARGLDASSAVLIYPEGTRFSEAKLQSALAALRERSTEQLAALASTLKRSLPPRLRGPLALLDAAPDVDVVFVEHSGLEGASTFSRFWNGALVRQTLRVRLRRFPAATIPAGARALWLFQRWAELDHWLLDPNGQPEANLTPRDL